MQSDVNSLLPMRGNSVHEIIENDHEMIRGMLESLTRTQARDMRMQTLEQLKAALTIHNAMEESIVYPALNKIAGHKFETMKLYNETASADMMLFEIDTMLKEGDDDRIAEKAEKLQAAVLKHMESEEHKAMPHLERGADSQESQMVLQSVRMFRNSMRFMPAGGMTGRMETGEIGIETASETSRMQP